VRPRRTEGASAAVSEEASEAAAAVSAAAEWARGKNREKTVDKPRRGLYNMGMIQKSSISFNCYFSYRFYTGGKVLCG
jgi:hypothetical protein